MVHFVGLDVPVKETSVCVVDNTGKVILEQKVPTEPADIIALLSSLGRVQKIPFNTRRSSWRGTPRGLFGSSGAITAHS